MKRFTGYCEHPGCDKRTPETRTCRLHGSKEIGDPVGFLFVFVVGLFFLLLLLLSACSSAERCFDTERECKDDLSKRLFYVHPTCHEESK